MKNTKLPISPHLQIALSTEHDDRKEKFNILRGEIEIFKTLTVPFSGEFNSKCGNSMKLDDSKF